jgi:hypothetical protein
LAESNVNVENASGFVCGERAVLLIEVKDAAAAKAALKGKGLRLLNSTDCAEQKMW